MKIVNLKSMDIDSHYWSETDQTVCLPNLFEYLQYSLEEKTATYMRYSKAQNYYIVIRTKEGYYYYNCAHPEHKLRASDSIASFCAAITTSSHSSIWERIKHKYEEYLASGLDSTILQELTEVSLDYNHFLSITTTVNTRGLITLYQKALAIPALTDTMKMDKEGYLLFPIYNTENVVCGYLKDTPSGIQPHTSTTSVSGIWYTNVPKKTDQLIIFSSPKEALAFYVQYQPENTVCISMSTLDMSTHRTILKLQKITKAKKIWYSYTGTTVLKSYCRDMDQIALLQYPNFVLHTMDTYIRVVLRQPERTLFSKFYKKLQGFNETIIAEYKKYNQTKSVHQNLVSQYSIILKQTEEGDIHCRVPLEINALKFFLCTYQQYFLSNTVGILKPKEVSWYRAFSKNAQKETTLDYKELKLAV